MTSGWNLPNSSYCFSPCSKECVYMFTIKFPQLTTVYIHAIRIKQGGKGVTITITFYISGFVTVPDDANRGGV